MSTRTPATRALEQHTAKVSNDPDPNFYLRRHLRFGWWALFVFLSVGIVLEALHAFKIGWYLDVSNEARRLLWTLGHAHGTLLSLINIVFATTSVVLTNLNVKVKSFISNCLLAATILIPGGFLMGGFFIHSGDPGLGILLLPVGAIFLLVSVFLIARSTNRSFSQDSQVTGASQQSARTPRK